MSQTVDIKELNERIERKSAFSQSAQILFSDFSS
jgi:hypothetical protein